MAGSFEVAWGSANGSNLSRRAFTIGLFQWRMRFVLHLRPAPTVIGGTLRLGILVFLIALSGCAGATVRMPVPSEEIEGRIVQSVVLADGDEVYFDEWESASPGRDKRARVREGSIVGYVGGVHRRINLTEVQEITLGVDDSKRTVATVSITVIAVTVGVLVAMFLYALSTIELS